MKKFRVEVGFGENFMTVDEYQAIDETEEIEAETAEEAARKAACIDGLENALFCVYELYENEFGKLEYNNGRYFSF